MPQAPAPTFVFRMTLVQRVMAVIFLLGLGSTGFCWGLKAWRGHDPLALVPVLVYAGLLALGWRRFLRPLPSRVVRMGDTLVFLELPASTMGMQGLNLSFRVPREARVPVAAMVPEWIGDALTWNDLESGQTVWLAQGSQARELMTWLRAQGVAEPVVGPPA